MKAIPPDMRPELLITPDGVTAAFCDPCRGRFVLHVIPVVSSAMRTRPPARVLASRRLVRIEGDAASLLVGRPLEFVFRAVFGHMDESVFPIFWSVRAGRDQSAYEIAI